MINADLSSLIWNIKIGQEGTIKIYSIEKREVKDTFILELSSLLNSKKLHLLLSIFMEKLEHFKTITTFIKTPMREQEGLCFLFKDLEKSDIHLLILVDFEKSFLTNGELLKDLTRFFPTFKLPFVESKLSHSKNSKLTKWHHQFLMEEVKNSVEKNIPSLVRKSNLIKMAYLEWERIYARIFHLESLFLEKKSFFYYGMMKEYRYKVEGVLENLDVHFENSSSLTYFKSPNHLSLLFLLKQDWSELGDRVRNSSIWHFFSKIDDFSSHNLEELLKESFSGPWLRNLGVAYDLRKLSPYLQYHEFPLQIKIGMKGDLFDFINLLVEETSDSIQLVIELMEKLFQVETSSDFMKIEIAGAATKSSLYRAYESPIGEIGVLEGHKIIWPNYSL